MQCSGLSRGRQLSQGAWLFGWVGFLKYCITTYKFNKMGVFWSSNLYRSVTQRAWKTWSGIYAMKMTPVMCDSSSATARLFRMTSYQLSFSTDKTKPCLTPASGMTFQTALQNRFVWLHICLFAVQWFTLKCDCRKVFLSFLFFFPFILFRLMVNLTQPAMLCFGKIPDDPVFRHHFMQVTSHLQAYKEVSL